MQFQSSIDIQSGCADRPRPIPSLLTVLQFSEKHPAFKVRSLRHLVFWAQTRHTNEGTIQANGLERALVRVGRKLLIDETKFFEWLEYQQACRTEISEVKKALRRPSQERRAVKQQDTNRRGAHDCDDLTTDRSRPLGA